MRRPRLQPRTLASRESTRGWSRARCALLSLARVALVCYLMPVILLVFAIGGLAIGAGFLGRLTRPLGDLLPGRSPSMRGLVVLPLARKSGFSDDPGGTSYRKPRCAR